MKKLVSLLLALCLCLSLAPLSLAEDTPAYLSDVSPVTLKMYFDRPVDGNLVAQANGKEPLSVKWKEETGVTIDFAYAVDDSHTKLNMMITSGDYPDILICQASYDMLQDLADNGVIVAFNQVEDEYDPGFLSRTMSANTILSVRQKFATQDVFALPIYSFKVEDLQRSDIGRCMTGQMVRKSIYESIGSPDMTTVEGFLDAFRKVKEMYPDIIPVQASRNSSNDGDGNPRIIGKALQYFDLQGGYYLDESDGVYKKYWNNPNYVELLKFVNTLYNEGLMDPAELTDSGEQLQAKLFSGKIFCNLNNDADNTDWFNNEFVAAGIDDEWTFVEQMSINTEEGYTYDNINGGVGDHYIIVFNTPNAKRSMMFLDYLMQDEQQIEILMGIQGQTWDYNEDGVAKLFDDIQALTDAEKKTTYGIGLWYFLRQELYNNILKKYSGSEEQTANIEFMSKYYKDYSFITGAKVENYTSDSEEIKIFTNIKEYYEVQIRKIIMAAPDQVEPMYQEMMAKIYDLGQAKLDAYIDNFLKNKAESAMEYGSDLDLSFMGL